MSAAGAVEDGYRGSRLYPQDAKGLTSRKPHNLMRYGPRRRAGPTGTTNSGANVERALWP